MQLTANELTWETGSLGSNPASPFFASQKTEKSRPPKLQSNFGGRTLRIV